MSPGETRQEPMAPLMVVDWDALARLDARLEDPDALPASPIPEITTEIWAPVPRTGHFRASSLSRL